MADDTTEGAEGATSEAAETETQETGEPAELGDAGKKAIKAERDRAAAAEKKAKQLEDELAEFRKSQMSDQERAIDEARATARAEVLGEVGSKVVAAEFRAAAAGRMEADTLSSLLDGLNLSSFMDESGDVLVDKVKALVEGITPTPTQSTDFGQGSRTSNLPLGSDPLLQALKNTVGAR